MKVAYIVLKGMPLGGGIEKYTEEIGSRLAKKGHKIIVYAMGHYGARDGTFKGMNIRTVSTLKSKYFEKIAASFLATVKSCVEKDIDIIHFHAFGPAMFSFIPRIFNKKVVVQGHGLEWKRSRWGLLGKLFLKLAEIPSVRFPNIISVVSKVQENYLNDKYGSQGIYIPTGVNPPRVEEPDLMREYGLRGKDYILFTARLVREKGAHYLIEAFRRLKTDLKLVIAGDAAHEDAYKAQLYQLAAGNNNIIFTGFVTGKILHELFSNCYLFVLPSEIEGLPTALLEAMSYGNCCLVSNIPENLEALDRFGYTFRNGDVNDLTEKLKYLINNANALEAVKKQAKEYVLKNYSWDTIAEKFENLYETLLFRCKHWESVNGINPIC